MVDLERTGNLFEAGFWVLFGVMLAVAARRKRAVRRLGLVSCLISVLFGISDLVEASTGAWWRPWWLLLWKAVCVSGLAVCFLAYRKLRSMPSEATASSPQAASSSM